MGVLNHEIYGVSVERDDAERLGEDDMATLREGEFRQVALADHQRQVERAAPIARGICINCEEQCHPLAVYCDADCRADHERRVRAQALQRSAAG